MADDRFIEVQCYFLAAGEPEFGPIYIRRGVEYTVRLLDDAKGLVSVSGDGATYRIVGGSVEYVRRSLQSFGVRVA